MPVPRYSQQPNVTDIPCPEDYHYEFFTAAYRTDMYRTGSVGAEMAAKSDAEIASNDMVEQVAKNVRKYLDKAKCQGPCTRTLIYISGPQINGPWLEAIPNPRHQWETQGYIASVTVTEYLIIGCNKPGAPPAKVPGKLGKGKIKID